MTDQPSQNISETDVYDNQWGDAPTPVERQYDNPQPESTSFALVVTTEGVIYAVLFSLVALMFTLSLGVVPLTENEITRALAAWQALQLNAEPSAIADSALLQLGHLITLGMLGDGEAVLRLPTALTAIALVFSPLLFRDLLGKARTLIFSVLLAVSPIVIASARLDHPAVWEVGLTLLGLWAIVRYLRSDANKTPWAVTATTLLAGAALLAGPTGHVFVLILLLGLLIADQLNPHISAANLISVGRAWPWITAVSFAALAVVVISTVFMLYPRGLDA
ncbi:MAG: hypothetical protein AAF125_22535, partial [Chloroflexota bacterium]